MRKALLALTLLPAAALAQQSAPPSLGAGYLGGTPMLDSILLSPAPPAAGSAAEARDVEASKAGLALRDTPRWELAKADADLFGGKTANAFSCAAGRAVGPEATPAVDKVLRRTLPDLGLSTAAIKRQFQRPRPFMVNGQPSCTPAEEAGLRGNGSYPSGHSAIGYGWSLILAQLLPDQAAAIVARGRAFGDSRRVCNVHWLSDIEEGRIAAAATVARLNADPAFRTDLEAARAELRSRAPVAPTGCDAERAALDLVR